MKIILLFLLFVVVCSIHLGNGQILEKEHDYLNEVEGSGNEIWNTNVDYAETQPGQDDSENTDRFGGYYPNFLNSRLCWSQGSYRPCSYLVSNPKPQPVPQIAKPQEFRRVNCGKRLYQQRSGGVANHMRSGGSPDGESFSDYDLSTVEQDANDGSLTDRTGEELISSILKDDGFLNFEKPIKKTVSDRTFYYDGEESLISAGEDYVRNVDYSHQKIVDTSYDELSSTDNQTTTPEDILRIMGGSVANVKDWPWQVGIYTFNIHVCGGTLFSNRFVLTAAHCFNKYSNPEYFKIYLGKSKKSVQYVEAGQVERSIQKIIIHPSYSRKTYDNDIALIFLKKPVLYSSQIIRSCLPTWNTPNVPNLPACFVTGYGATKGTGGDDSLKVASIDIFSMEKCRSLGKKYETYLTDNMFCAGNLRGGTDSCQGDSGGPLVCEDPPKSRRYVLHGLVSFGWGCGNANSPGVYTRVSKYYNFLKYAMRTALRST